MAITKIKITFLLTTKSKIKKKKKSKNEQIPIKLKLLPNIKHISNAKTPKGEVNRCIGSIVMELLVFLKTVDQNCPYWDRQTDRQKRERVPRTHTPLSPRAQVQRIIKNNPTTGSR
jgi:hypothetical protein